MLIHLNVIQFPLTPRNTPFSRLKNSSTKEKSKRNGEKPKGITSALRLGIGKLCDIGMFIPAGSTFFYGLVFFLHFYISVFFSKNILLLFVFFVCLHFAIKHFSVFQTLTHTVPYIFITHKHKWLTKLDRFRKEFKRDKCLRSKCWPSIGICCLDKGCLVLNCSHTFYSRLLHQIHSTHCILFN